LTVVITGQQSSSESFNESIQKLSDELNSRLLVGIETKMDENSLELAEIRSTVKDLADSHFKSVTLERTSHRISRSEDTNVAGNGQRG
jgi:hypothetical protein